MNATIMLKEPEERLNLGPGANYEVMQDTHPTLLRVWDKQNSGWRLFPASRLVSANFYDEKQNAQS
jgi:hypothetical protein